MAIFGKRAFSYSLLAWITCGIVALLCTFIYIVRILPSVIGQDLASAYNLEISVIVSHLSLIYYAVYTLMQIPAGFLIDRYGPTKVLLFSCLISEIGMCLFASSHNFITVEISRFIVGLGTAFVFGAVLKLAIMHLSLKRFGMLAGVVTSMGMFGGILANTLLAILNNFGGWRFFAFIIALLSFLFVLLLSYFLVEPRKNKNKNAIHLENNTWKNFYKIIIDPQIILSGMIGCLMYLPIPVFIELLGSTYLEKTFTLSPFEATKAIVMFSLGFALGGPLVGFIADKIGQRRILITSGAVGAAVLLAYLLYIPGLAIDVMQIMFFICGLFLSAQVLIFVVSRQSIFINSAGMVISFLNFLIMLSSVVFRPLIINFLRFLFKFNSPATTTISLSSASFFSAISVDNFQLALISLPFCLILGMVLSFFLKEGNLVTSQIEKNNSL